MASILPRVLAAALAAGGLGSAGALVHADQEARENGRYIEVLVAPVTIPAWGRPIVARTGQFLLSEEVGSGKRLNRTFPITVDELGLVQGDRPGFIIETPERRRVLEGFVAELSAQGWRSAGKGEAWYSHRVRRPSAVGALRGAG